MDEFEEVMIGKKKKKTTDEMIGVTQTGHQFTAYLLVEESCRMEKIE